MTIATCVTLLLFLFPLAYSPGPGNAFFAGIGASRGIRAAVPALAGYHVATLIVTASVGLGMGATVLRQPAVAQALAVLGSGYVLWLAWRLLRQPRNQEASAPGTPHHSIGFGAGVMILVLNPKAYYILAVMFTQFLRPPLDDDIATVLAISVAFTLNNLIAFVAWTFAGKGLSLLFHGDKSKKWIDYACAVTLGGVAVWMVLPVLT